MSTKPTTSRAQPLTLEESKARVETYLHDYVADRKYRATTLSPAYAQLWSTVEQLLGVGGKRLRPHLTLLSYQAYAGEAPNVEAIIPAAAAQELLHVAMLIHDDIIDRDDIRYGVANVSGQYRSLYRESVTDEAERSHYVDSAAILAGDALLSDAYKLIAESAADAATILKAQMILNDAVFTVIGGELLDTESAFVKRGAEPIDIARYKTASYSFISPLLMGATFAGAPPTEIEALRNIGEAVGVAYQLQDDLLGMFGDSTVTGKSSTSDLSEGKYTELIRTFYERANEAQRSQFDDIFGRADIGTQEAERAQQLLVDSGAKQATEDHVGALTMTASQTIDQLTITDEYKTALGSLLTGLINRDK